MKQHTNFLWFDLFRGSAALLVLIEHVRALMFFEYSGNRGILQNGFYFITGFGHEAVIIFFVLSGFFIIKTIYEKFLSNRWNVKEYAINRLVRLWVVLLPALLLTFFWDSIGLYFYKDHFTYAGTLQYLPDINPNNHLGIKTFIGNVFFLQKITVPTYGSNGALWSLAYEFWYYVMFPCIFFIFAKYYSIVVRFLCFILLIICFLLIGKEIALYFFVWLMGGVTFILIKNNLLFKSYSNFKAILFFMLFSGWLVAIRFKMYPQVMNDFSLSLVTCLMLASFAHLKMNNNTLKRISIQLSNLSYTLYLTHLSFAVLLVSVFFNTRMELTPLTFLYFSIVIFAIVVYSICIYLLFELNTIKVKAFVNGFMPKQTLNN